MSSRWWYGVAFGSVYILLYQLPVATVVSATVADYLQGGAVLASAVAAVSLHHDFVSIRERATWDLTLPLWVVGAFVVFGSAIAGPAYCFRRYSAVRGTAPSGRWRYVVYVALLAWLGVLVAILVSNSVLGVVDVSLFDSALWWAVSSYVYFLLPIALYLDVEHARAFTDLSPNTRVLVGLSLVPVVNLVTTGLYLVGRHRHLDTTSETPSFSGAERATPEQISPWFLRAIDVGVVYAVTVALVNSTAPLGFGANLPWPLLALLLWPPFGVLYSVCVYYDTAAMAETGIEWTRSELYYAGVLVPVVAFVYLLIRHEKARDWRQVQAV